MKRNPRVIEERWVLQGLDGPKLACACFKVHFNQVQFDFASDVNWNVRIDSKLKSFFSSWQQIGLSRNLAVKEAVGHENSGQNQNLPTLLRALTLVVTPSHQQGERFKRSRFYLPEIKWTFPSEPSLVLKLEVLMGRLKHHEVPDSQYSAKRPPKEDEEIKTRWLWELCLLTKTLYCKFWWKWGKKIPIHLFPNAILNHDPLKFNEMKI